jgi:hypothetical protein
MPYRFSFTDSLGQPKFQCPIQCAQCAATSARSGAQCGRRVCIGLPCCWQHLRSNYNVTIQNSMLHGKGLFAWANGGNAQILFRKGDRIVPYGGELLTHAELVDRYGPDTAPYGVKLSNVRFVDGACSRGAGSVANASSGGSPPNAKLVVNAQKGSVSIRATRPIRNGDEILVSYGPAYWNQPAGTYRTK